MTGVDGAYAVRSFSRGSFVITATPPEGDSVTREVSLPEGAKSVSIDLELPAL